MTNTDLNLFTESEIPYEVLKNYGISQQMVEDMPQPVMTRLLSGRESPVLTITAMDSNSKPQPHQSSFFFSRKSDGTVDVTFIPVWKEKNLSEYDEEQQQLLLSGKVIKVDNPGQGECYVQYNDSIQQTMIAPVDLITHNIKIIGDYCGLSDEEMDDLLQGKIHEITKGDEVISLGIDLNHTTCYRICQGDAEVWRQQTSFDNLQKYNFGLFGCWIYDAYSNSMNYVAEENYSDDLINQMKLAGEQRAAYYQFRR